MKIVEYRVRPVTRYLVTRYESDPSTGSGAVETLGEFDNESYASRVKEALAKSDPGGEALPLSPPPDATK